MKRKLSVAPREDSGRDGTSFCRPTESIPAAPGTPADIWAFGCLLAEALIGRKLFRAGDQLAAVDRYVSEAVRFIEIQRCFM